MELENDSPFDTHSLFPALSDHENGMAQPRLDRIDSNLFLAGDQSFHLDKFFDMRHSAFLEKETSRFSTSFRTQYAHYQSKFTGQEPQSLDRVLKLPNFRRNCAALLSKHTEKLLDAVFLIKSNTPVGEFINNLYHKSFEFCFGQISILAEYLGEVISPQTPSDLEANGPASKKVFWSAPEEKELLDLIAKTYPLPVPSEDLIAFCSRRGRTRSGVTNKIHKLKRKFENDFRQKNIDIFSGFMESSVSGALEQSVLNVIQSENEATYESILSRLKVQSSQIEERNSISQILYTLLNRNKIRCDDRIFVELNDSPANCQAASLPPILKKVVEAILKKPDLSISLEDMRDVLVAEFNITDKRGAELDSHLLDFLQKSKFVCLKRKRVFY